MSNYSNRSNRSYDYARSPVKTGADWKRIEQKKQGAIVVEVSQQAARVPRFSVRVGVSREDENGQVLDVLPYMSIYMLDDAIKTLQQIRDKYVTLRESFLQENEPVRPAGRYGRVERPMYEGDDELDGPQDGPVTAPAPVRRR
jgi:hypothetical protein